MECFVLYFIEFSKSPPISTFCKARINVYFAVILKISFKSEIGDFEERKKLKRNLISKGIITVGSTENF